MQRKFKIQNRIIGENYPPVVIAEIGINHNGSLDRAIYLSEMAIKAGAEIIKHQTHIAEDEMSVEAKKIKPGNSNLNIFSIIENSQLSEKNEIKLAKFVKQKKKIFISSPFSKKAVDRLEKIGVPAYKIGSGECNNYPLVEYICKKKKPVILSTGMNDIKSISKSVKLLRKYKNPYALLHCTNIYPTPNKLVRLECLNDLKKNFPDAVIGFSDHTETIYSCLGAVTLGARILEKHFVDTKKRKGPDVSCSMDKSELKQLINGSKLIFSSLKGKKKALKEESKTIKFAFASVVATRDIQKGEKLSKNNIFTKRPGNGYFGIGDYNKLLGRIALNNLKKNHQIKKKDVS
ncbi:MAG: N-acetylneuraminate synthase family protein [Candidatus Pelagibacter sp.]